MVVLDGNFALSWIGLPLNTYIHCVLELTDATTNEVLEVITFVLVFPTVYGENSAVDALVYRQALSCSRCCELHCDCTQCSRVSKHSCCIASTHRKQRGSA
jgi:hypothetical protein